MRRQMPIFDGPISSELNEAFIASIGGIPYCGLAQYNRILETIKANPKYFPWEHKLNSVPKEVHEAYKRELNPDWDKPFEFKSTENGICRSSIKEQCVPPVTLTEDMIKDFIFELSQMDERKRKAEERKMNILNKHYAKYGVYYNGGLDIYWCLE